MKEHRQSDACFTFTEHEQLYDRITHERFLKLIRQPGIEVHEVKLDTNSFGEYLFVTLSCRVEPREVYTFWGLGYHEYRERWLTDHWQWYESSRPVERLPSLLKTKAYTQLEDRAALVRANATAMPPSRQAQLYELLAALTDEDGALTELEDLGWMFFNAPEDYDEE